MTIVAMRSVHVYSEWQPIGVALYTLSRNHVVQFDGQRGIGMSYGSCNAAVAVERGRARDAHYLDAPAGADAGVNGLDFSAIYGSSRLYAGLDADANAHVEQGTGPFSSSLRGQHAEQTAIIVAQGLGIPFWHDHLHGRHCHIYVDFTPCEHCEPWLRAHPVEWVVHYGVQLAQKRDFERERKKRFTDIARERRLEKRQQEQKAAGQSALNIRRGLMPSGRR